MKGRTEEDGTNILTEEEKIALEIEKKKRQGFEESQSIFDKLILIINR